jgi:hypothetical protein
MPQSRTENDRIAYISQRFLSYETSFGPEYLNYDDCWNFMIGNQYTKEQRDYFETIRRPSNVWNLIFPVFCRLLGEFLMTYRNVHVFPETIGDPRSAASLQKILEDLHIRGDFDQELAATYLSGLVKRGYIQISYDGSIIPTGSPVIKNQDEYEIMFDPRAKHRYLKDAKDVYRSIWMEADDMYALWPNHKTELKKILVERKDQHFISNQADKEWMLGSSHFYNENEGKYRVIEYNEKTNVAGEKAYNPVTGKTEFLYLEGKKRELFLASNPGMIVIPTREAEQISKTFIVPAINFMLEERQAEICDGYFDYIPFSAYSMFSKKTINSFGIVGQAKGPQKDFNDTRNRIADILNKATGSINEVIPSKIDNYTEYKEHGTEPDFNLEIKEGYGLNESIKKHEAPRVPEGHTAYADGAFMLFQRILNVTENMFGQTQTSGENATLFSNRVREAQKTFYPIDKSIIDFTDLAYNRCIRLINQNWKGPSFYTLYSKPQKGMVTLELNKQVGSTIENDMQGVYKVYPTLLEQNQTQRALLFMQKTELAMILFKNLGPQVNVYDWWLRNSDFEDIDELVAEIQKTLGVLGQQGQKMDAMSDVQAVMDAALKQKQLTEVGGSK